MPHPHAKLFPVLKAKTKYIFAVSQPALLVRRKMTLHRRVTNLSHGRYFPFIWLPIRQTTVVMIRWPFPGRFTFNQPAGAAIHGAFWHNDFGVQRSHGCVNVSPEDAKWIYRWTTPFLSLDQSEWRETDSSKVGGSFSTNVTVTVTKP